MILLAILFMSTCSAGSSYAWDFSLPKDLDSVPQLAERTFFNYTTLGTSGSLAVVNKTTAAYTAGVILASAFLAGTLIYTLEENQASSSSSAKLSNRVDGFLSDFFATADDAGIADDSAADSAAMAAGKKGKKRRKKKVEPSTDCSDCETYCYNKYYYGDPYHAYDTPTADGSTYSKRYVVCKKCLPAILSILKHTV